MMKIMSEKKSRRGFKLASLGILPAILGLAMLLSAGPGFAAANRYGLMVGIDRRPDGLDRGFGKHDRNETVLRAVVAEDVGEARCDDGFESVLLKCPDCVFSR